VLELIFGCSLGIICTFKKSNCCLQDLEMDFIFGFSLNIILCWSWSSAAGQTFAFGLLSRINFPLFLCQTLDTGFVTLIPKMWEQKTTLQRPSNVGFSNACALGGRISDELQRFPPNSPMEGIRASIWRRLCLPLLSALITRSLTGIHWVWSARPLAGCCPSIKRY